MESNQKVEERKEATETSFRIEIVTPEGKKIEIPKGLFTGRDSVMFLRDILADYQDVCHHTNYQLEAVDSKKKHVTVLNDFADFSEYPDVVSEKSHLRMKLIPYTLASCHEHVRVIRNIIVDPPVSIPTAAAAAVTKQVSSETTKKPQEKQQQKQQEQQQQQEQKKEQQDLTSKDNKKSEEETKEENKTVVTNPKSHTHKLIQDAVRTRKREC